jgi:hypothetical protein
VEDVTTDAEFADENRTMRARARERRAWSMEAPSPNGVNGRDAQGRFLPGNPGGPGNPFARRSASLRRAFLEAVSDADLQAIARTLVERAKGGDLAAMKLVFLWVLGKPGEPIAVDAVLHEGGPEGSGADDSPPPSPLALPEDRRQRERLAVAELLREARIMITGPRDPLAGGPGSP